MTWVYLFVGLGGVLALARIYFNVRKLAAKREDDWDARLIAQLRASGANPFEAQDVDFFLALPSPEIAETVATQLRAEGFEVQLRMLQDSVSQPVALDARRRMQLSVPDVRALSERFRTLAVEHGGRYDSWSATRATPPA